MKIRHLTLALAAMALFSTMAVEGQKTMTARTIPIIEGGVGPAISGSVEYTQIPEEARKFIDRHFRHLTINRCEKDFDDSDIDIVMSDGTEIEFDAHGQWTDVEAPDGMAFTDSFIRNLLPRKAYDDLKHRRLSALVESVKRERTGFEVEVANARPSEYHFSDDGRLLRAGD